MRAWLTSCLTHVQWLPIMSGSFCTFMLYHYYYYTNMYNPIVCRYHKVKTVCIWWVYIFQQHHFATFTYTFINVQSHCISHVIRCTCIHANTCSVYCSPCQIGTPLLSNHSVHIREASFGGNETALHIFPVLAANDSYSLWSVCPITYRTYTYNTRTTKVQWSLHFRQFVQPENCGLTLKAVLKLKNIYTVK